MSSNNENFILEIDGVSKYYDGVNAIDDISLKIHYNEVHAIVGENGAGKSTLMKIIGGIILRDRGRIKFLGKEVNFQKPSDAIAAGISFIHQELSLVSTLSVMINIFMNHIPGWFGIIRINELEKKVGTIMEKVGLNINPHILVKDLSFSQRQLVEVAKAISLNSRLIIMDEPNSTLTEKETERLFQLIDELKKMGVSIIYVSHKIEEVLKISDRISVLRDGRYVGTLDKKNANLDMIIQMMIGRNLMYSTLSGTYKKGPVLLEVHELTGKKFKNVSFTLRAGEILGFAGLVGAGRSEVARAIFGDEPYHSGYIIYENKRIKFKSPKEAIKNGIVMVQEDRKDLSLFIDLSVDLNMSITKLPEISRGGIIARTQLYDTLNEMVHRLNIKLNYYGDPISRLSGGNQQKAVLARWLAMNPKLLILDEPTHGIDIGVKLEIYQLIHKLARKGIGIILVSSELPEIMMMADRVIVMRDGHITGILEEDQIAEDAIMTYATYDSVHEKQMCTT